MEPMVASSWLREAAALSSARGGIVLALAAVLFVLSTSVWLPELLAMLATVLAAILATASVLLFCVWLTKRRDQA